MKSRILESWSRHSAIGAPTQRPACAMTDFAPLLEAPMAIDTTSPHRSVVGSV